MELLSTKADVGALITSKRALQRINQTQAAHKANLSLTTVVSIEDGSAGNDVTMKLARAMGLSRDEIYQVVQVLWPQDGGK